MLDYLGANVKNPPGIVLIFNTLLNNKTLQFRMHADQSVSYQVYVIIKCRQTFGQKLWRLFWWFRGCYNSMLSLYRDNHVLQTRVWKPGEKPDILDNWKWKPLIRNRLGQSELIIRATVVSSRLFLRPNCKYVAKGGIGSLFLVPKVWTHKQIKAVIMGLSLGWVWVCLS